VAQPPHSFRHHHARRDFGRNLQQERDFSQFIEGDYPPPFLQVLSQGILWIHLEKHGLFFGKEVVSLPKRRI
jgi:hypothetical protein